ncbi:MAG: sugar transferase [Puniceicoccaceae bacterium]|nr:MAG: sugar transferase [Puniceicoccaceae bacterium]
MLKNRQEGLTTLHGLWVLILMSALFYGYHFAVQSSGLIELISFYGIGTYFLLVVGGTLLALRTFHAWSQKLPRLTWLESLRLTQQQMLRLALVLFAFVVVAKDAAMSRLFLAGFLVFAALLLLLCNRYLPRLLCRIIFQTHRVPTLFIGGADSIARLDRWIREKAYLGVDPVGYLSNEEPDPEVSLPLARLGTIADLNQILSNQPVGQVILLQNYLPPDTASTVIDDATRHGCRIRIYNNWEDHYQHRIVVDHEGEFTFFTLQDEPLENPINRFIKRLFDIAFSLPIVAFVLPPLTLCVYLAQKRQSPGPVFYTQPRTGITKRTFQIIKFRTMHLSDPQDGQRARQATKDDDRIYAFGRFLRRTSLDELPQFINVLLGDMSVAGPRPHLINHDVEFSKILKTYYTRHLVKPGITGLAQCKGFRGEVSELESLKQRISYDITYINNWSFLLDIQIILATAKAVLFPPKSAY